MLCVCVCACALTSALLRNTKEGIRPPESGVTGETPHMGARSRTLVLCKSNNCPLPPRPSSLSSPVLSGFLIVLLKEACEGWDGQKCWEQKLTNFSVSMLQSYGIWTRQRAHSEVGYLFENLAHWLGRFVADPSGWWGWRPHAPFIFLLWLAWNSQWFLSKESMFSSPFGPHKLRTVSKRQYTSEKLWKERCPLGQLLADSQSVTFWKTESGKISGCQEVEVHGVIFPERVSCSPVHPDMATGK